MNIDYNNLMEQGVSWLVTSGLQILLIFALMFFALMASRTFADYVISLWRRKDENGEMEKRKTTLNGIVRNSLSFMIVTVSFIMVLGELGIEVGPLLATAGVFGIAIGFGAQKLVEDVISGFFILWNDQIRVDDVVEIAGIGGLVEKVDLRMVVLRDLSGNVHFVRNGQIGVVTNMTKEYSRYLFDIGVAYREDTDEVVKVIKEVDEELRQDAEYAGDILEPIEILGVDKFADSAVVIKARIKTRPIKQWGVGREFNRRLKKAFDERGIEIPFPHTTLYMGQDKDGSSPALNIRAAVTNNQ